ncbi:MAG: hypothetical protein ACFCVE_12190 [Phycisphaerae bacterium]
MATRYYQRMRKPKGGPEGDIVADAAATNRSVTTLADTGYTVGSKYAVMRKSREFARRIRKETAGIPKLTSVR